MYDFECESSNTYAENPEHPCYYRQVQSGFPGITNASDCVGVCGGNPGELEEVVVYKFESTCKSDVCARLSGRRGSQMGSEMRISRTRPCLTSSCGAPETVIDEDTVSLGVFSMCFECLIQFFIKADSLFSTSPF